MNRRDVLALAVLPLMSLVQARRVRADSTRNDAAVIGDLIVLGPFDLSVLRRAQVRAIMTVMVDLVVEDDTARSRIVATVPRLRALYFDQLRRLAESQDLAGWLDVDQIAARLQAATDRSYGDGTARVLIVHAVMRRVS